MRRRAALGVAVATLVLTACAADHGGSSSASGHTSNPEPASADPAAAGSALTTVDHAQLVVRSIGDRIAFGDVELTVLAVQDPFPATAQTQPQPGDRLVSIKYEVINHDGSAHALSDLPAIELRDSTGASYTSEHARLSLVAGSRTPGELLPDKRMEASVLYEVPLDARGLRAVFSGTVGSDKQTAVTLD
jgi:hypothetical protein